jgi:hypothetical protein
VTRRDLWTLHTLLMATEDPAFIPIDIHHPETAKTFIAFLEPLPPFGRSLTGLIHSRSPHAPTRPLPQGPGDIRLLLATETTSEVPGVCSPLRVFTPDQGRLFCSADASPEDVTPEELVYRETAARLYAVTATSLVRDSTRPRRRILNTSSVLHAKSLLRLVKTARGGRAHRTAAAASFTLPPTPRLSMRPPQAQMCVGGW